MHDERAALLRMLDELSEHITSTLDALGGGVTCPGCEVPPVRRRGRVLFAHRGRCAWEKRRGECADMERREHGLPSTRGAGTPGYPSPAGGQP